MSKEPKPGRPSNVQVKHKRQTRWDLYHPLLFAFYPVLSLYATNLREIPFSETLRSILVVEVLALCLLLLGRVVLKSWTHAACFASLTCCCFSPTGISILT